MDSTRSRRAASFKPASLARQRRTTYSPDVANRHGCVCQVRQRDVEKAGRTARSEVGTDRFGQVETIGSADAAHRSDHRFAERIRVGTPAPVDVARLSDLEPDRHLSIGALRRTHDGVAERSFSQQPTRR
jgi:hypothetical protein